MGGVSLLLFIAAFSSAPYPGGRRAIRLPCSGLHPQGFAVSPYPTLRRISGLLARGYPVLPYHFWLNRIIAQGRPCRFCAIAVAPATRTCIRLRTRPVGGLSSAAFRPPSAALSLSRVVWMVKDDKGSVDLQLIKLEIKYLFFISDTERDYSTLLGMFAVPKGKGKLEKILKKIFECLSPRRCGT